MIYIDNLSKILALGLVFFIPLSNTFTTVLSLLLLICCLLNMDRHTFKQLAVHPVTRAICILLGLYLIGAIYSIAEPRQIEISLRKMSRLIFIPLLLPLFIDLKWRKYALVAYLAALIMSIASIFVMHRLVFKDNIFTSLFVAYAIFVLCHFLYRFKSYKYVILSALAFLVFYLFFDSYGRTGQVLAIMLYAIFCWQRFRFNLKKQKIALLLLIMIIACCVLLPTSFAARQVKAANEFKSYVQNTAAPVTESSVGARMAFAQNSWELVKQRPIFGWGTGAFSTAYAKHLPDSRANDINTVNPHNQYLLTAVELGLLGVFSLLYLFFTLLREFWRSKEQDAQLGFGLICAIAVGCLVNSWLLDYASMFFFVILTGILVAATRPTPNA